jgi:hypothetical protein
MYRLGEALELARAQAGFNRLLDRLREVKGFFSAEFEVEVAASYLRKGYGVEFIKEGKTKTPDLRVTAPNGVYFEVECKCREQGSNRDYRIEAVWNELESSLLKVMGPQQNNALIIVIAQSDPAMEDVKALRSWILHSIADCKSLGAHSIKSNFVSEIKPERTYEVEVVPLTPSDIRLASKGLEVRWPESMDREFVTCEMMLDESGKTFVWNPIALGFKNRKLSDKVSGIMNAFSKAADQLPAEGPGVIWIRIPDNLWNDGLDSNLERARTLLQSQLTGNKNQRINAVILLTYASVRELQNMPESMAHQPLNMIVMHQNPKVPHPETLPNTA